MQYSCALTHESGMSKASWFESSNVGGTKTCGSIMSLKMWRWWTDARMSHGAHFDWRADRIFLHTWNVKSAPLYCRKAPEQCPAPQSLTVGDNTKNAFFMWIDIQVQTSFVPLKWKHLYSSLYNIWWPLTKAYLSAGKTKALFAVKCGWHFLWRVVWRTFFKSQWM